MISLVNIEQAQKILQSNDVVAIPTETVYGLAGDITNEEALKKIFHIKERPFFDPLIVHISTPEQAQALTTNWTPIHEILAKNCWPGPLTLIADTNPQLVSPLITSGLSQVGLRSPNHHLTQKLLESFPKGLAAPSANKFGKTSPTTPQHVYSEFGESVSIIDGGTCSIGIESTVISIDFDNRWIITIYRSGFYNKNNIADILSKNNISNFIISYGQSPVAPGQLIHHYQPKLPIILNSDLCINSLARIIRWNLPSDPTLAARLLYAKFREFSDLPVDEIHINYPISYEVQEEWQGVMNRLKKASLKN